MKHLLYVAAILAFFSCSSTQKATSAKANTTSANDLQVRIKNNSDLLITKLVINNGTDETFTFQNIKARKTSAYQPVNYLCSCGYNIEIQYTKREEHYSIIKDCVNVMPCTDYFKGKLLINVKGTNPKDNEVELEFKPE